MARQCRRAGTVEVLRGVDLLELFSLYRRRFKCYGWDAEKQKSKFHLCHIAPVSGKDSIGLLHHLNLFIGSRFPNQVHGNNHYEGAGLAIKRSELLEKWKIGSETSDETILKKVEKYLGPVLSEYAKSNAIRKSQRFGLAKWIFNNDPNCQYTLNQLQRNGMQELRNMKAAIQEQEVYKLSLTPRRSLAVAIEECERLARQLPDGLHRQDLAFMAAALRCVAAWLWNEPGEYGFADVGAPIYGNTFNPVRLREDMDASALRDFASFQAFNALQGAEVNRPIVVSTLKKYLQVVALDPIYREADFLYVEDEMAKFREQASLVKDSILKLGLPDPEFLHNYLENAKEAQNLTNFYDSHSWSECSGEFDYPADYYQIEDDYVPQHSVHFNGWSILPF